jgi:hypothetical protein
MGKQINPNTILVWVQAAGQMTKLVETTVGSLKGMLAAAGATEAEQNAALDRTHAMYEIAIAHEQALIDGGRKD